MESWQTTFPRDLRQQWISGGGSVTGAEPMNTKTEREPTYLLSLLPYSSISNGAVRAGRSAAITNVSSHRTAPPTTGTRRLVWYWPSYDTCDTTDAQRARHNNVYFCNIKSWRISVCVCVYFKTWPLQFQGTPTHRRS
ncbi:hypothetical protein Vafri_6253 [Volvox africanus]|uniref:Uncharacterized protein n=1 Tax=Volvox africanus TaxID=51714 RepID=A0A8J4AYQ0_9CHLO|nr:hypothetical protein Vafri_6253 [Volvox africanus]